MNPITYRLGIDVSKEHLDCVIIDDQERKIFRKRVLKNESGFDGLYSWLNKKTDGNIHVCMEATGIYSADAAEYLLDKKISR